MRLTATTLHERGVAALEGGRLTDAERLLRRALDRALDTADADLRALVLASLSYVAAERGRVRDGLGLLDDVGQVSPKARARVESQRGLLLMRAGDAGGARDALTQAVRGLDEGDVLARTLLNRSNVHLQLRDLRRARDDCIGCIRVSESAGLAVLAAMARHNLGYVELLSGNIPSALREMDRARPVLAPLSPVSAAVGDADRATALIAAGLTSEAERALASAAAAFGRQRLRQSQAEAELLVARLALASGRPAEAARQARRAATRFRHRDSTSWALRADAVVLAGQVGSGQHAPVVVRTGTELAAALDTHELKDEARAVRLHVVQALLRADRSDKARDLVGSVRTPATAPITTRLLDRTVRADLATARRRPADAARHLRRGLAELFAWQSSFGSLDLQTGVAAHGRALAVRALQAAVADGRPEVVFDWSERARALAARVPPVRPPADHDAAMALEELRALRAEAAAGAPSAPDRRRMVEVEQQVRDRALYPAGPGIVTEPVALDDVQTRLAGDDGTLVSHLVVDDRLHALVVTSGAATVHALGPYAEVAGLMSRVAADLDAASTRLPAPLRAAIGTSLTSGCAALDKLMLGPVQRLDGPVLLVPSAALAAMPWTLFPSLAGRPVAVARTATSWALTRRPDETVGKVGLVAGPDVDRADEEVRRAARAWPTAETLGGDAVTAAAVTTLASRVDLLHVAAHGTHNADNPLFSGLELVDGPWFGHDIAAVAPVPGHVVLSACELGRSTVRAGEETLGMTAAWQHAGARTVIASPVRVNDDAACEVLARLHEGLARGDRPAVALAAGAGALPAGSAPAPLICFGAGW